MDSTGSRRFLIDAKKCEEHCTCGRRHEVPAVRVVSSDDAYAVLARDCAEALAGRPVLLIDDESTHQAAGAAVLERLEEHRVNTERITLPGGPVATEELARDIQDRCTDHDLIITVGAGTVSDLGKYVAQRREIPCWSAPTAPSMNGYASSIVAIKIKGVKRTLPSAPPQFIYVDPRVIRDSPLLLRQSGFCDVLAKSVSDFDWQTESLLFGGSYCALPSAIVNEHEGRYIEHPEGISRGDVDEVMGLFDGLLFSGVAMTLAGSSAPASGGEHLVSHFLDMREAITGVRPNLHGLQVGTGVILSALCYRKLAALEGKELEGRAQAALEAAAAAIPSVWGALAPEVQRQFAGKRDRLLRFDSILPANWSRLKALYSQVRSPEFFLALIRKTGLEMTLPSLGISRDEYYLAATTSRTIRDRITVLDLAAHAGILEEAAGEAVKMLS